MKKLLLVTTGGTIACHSTEKGLAPVLSSSQLLSYVPEASCFCSVDTVHLFNKDSTNMESSDWLRIALEIERNYATYDGFIVTHGTDTMAYTAAILSYLIQNSRKPIVVTGSQRPIDAENTDGRENLYNSLAFASDDRAHGVNIVFGSDVICGTRAKKERTRSYNAFSSINFPSIAKIFDGRCHFFIDDKPKEEKAPVFHHALCDRVAVLKLTPSLPADILSYIAHNYDGVVIESFGVGGIPSYGNYTRELERLKKMGKPVVLSTQVLEEGSDLSRYEVGKNAMEEYGLMECLDMTQEAAVMKLMWILGETKDLGEVKKLFYTPVNRDLIMK